MRTVLSEEQVARSGRVGWGAVSQAREGEEGLRVERREIFGREDGDGIPSFLGMCGGRWLPMVSWMISHFHKRKFYAGCV